MGRRAFRKLAAAAQTIETARNGPDISARSALPVINVFRTRVTLDLIENAAVVKMLTCAAFQPPAISSIVHKSIHGNCSAIWQPFFYHADGSNVCLRYLSFGAVEVVDICLFHPPRAGLFRHSAHHADRRFRQNGDRGNNHLEFIPSLCMNYLMSLIFPGSAVHPASRITKVEIDSWASALTTFALASSFLTNSCAWLSLPWERLRA